MALRQLPSITEEDAAGPARRAGRTVGLDNQGGARRPGRPAWLPSITGGSAAGPTRPAARVRPSVNPLEEGAWSARRPRVTGRQARSPTWLCARRAGAPGGCVIVMTSSSRSLVLVAHQHHAGPGPDSGSGSGSAALGHRPARSPGPAARRASARGPECAVGEGSISEDGKVSLTQTPPPPAALAARRCAAGAPGRRPARPRGRDLRSRKGSVAVWGPMAWFDHVDGSVDVHDPFSWLYADENMRSRNASSG